MRKRSILTLLTVLTLAAAAVILTGCSTPTKPGKAAAENTRGGYLAVQPYYSVRGGTLYAFNGVEWYSLRSYEVDAGEIRGASVGAGESWIKAGGSEVKLYYRTPQTFRDQSLKPVFVAY